MNKITFSIIIAIVCSIDIAICALGYIYDCDLISTVITNSVVIILFLISFYLLDSRTLKREENKRKVGAMLLIACAEECNKSINMLEDYEVVKKYIATKVNFSTSINNNPTILEIEKAPFLNEKMIITLFESGVLSADNLSLYLDLKNKHRDYVRLKIIMFDAGPPQSYQLNNIKNALEKAITNLIDYNNKEGK